MEKKKFLLVLLSVAMLLIVVQQGQPTTIQNHDVKEKSVVQPSTSPLMTYPSTNNCSYPYGQSGNWILFTKPIDSNINRYSIVKDGVNISSGPAPTSDFKWCIDNYAIGTHSVTMWWTYLYHYSYLMFTSVFVFQHCYNLSIMTSAALPTKYSVSATLNKTMMGYTYSGSKHGYDVLIQWFNSTSKRWDPIDLWNETSLSTTYPTIWFATQAPMTTAGDVTHYRILTGCPSLTFPMYRNGSNCFIFLDDFQEYAVGSSIDGQGGWTALNPGGGSNTNIFMLNGQKRLCVYSGNMLYPARECQVHHKISPAANNSNYYTIEACTVSNTPTQTNRIAFFDGSSDSNNYISNGYDAAFQGWSGGHQSKIEKYSSGSETDVQTSSAINMGANYYQDIGFRWTNKVTNNLEAYCNGTQFTGTDSYFTSNGMNYIALLSSYNVEWDFAWVRVRPMYDTSPSVTWIENKFPVASFSTNAEPTLTYTEGATATFTFNGTYGDMPMTYSWNFGDGSPTSFGISTSHVFWNPGTSPIIYSVVLNVTDANGDWNVMTRSVTVNNNAPNPDFSMNASTIIEKQYVLFSYTGSGGNAPLKFTWNFGDGPGNYTANDTAGMHPPAHQYLLYSSYNVRVTVTDVDGDRATSPVHVIVVQKIPCNFAICSPTGWVTSQTPSVICSFKTGTSGVDVSTAQFAYSTTGSSTPMNWVAVSGVYTDAACTMPASDGATGTLYAVVGSVAFNQESSSQNTIRFRVTDLAGNTGTQANASVIQIDSTPPSSFSIYSPTSSVNTHTPSVIVQFTVGVSGVKISSVQYAYSTTGAATPMNWAAVNGVYTDAACTTPASDGATGTLYAKVSAVAFNQDSSSQNTIRFRATDMAGNTGTQSSASVIQIDTTTIPIISVVVIGASVAAIAVVIGVQKKRKRKAKVKPQKASEAHDNLMPDVETPAIIAALQVGNAQKMHDILFGDKAIWEPIELATELGFKNNPENFYSFVSVLNGDTIRFYAGKILIDVNADANKKEEIFQQLQAFFQ